MAPVSRQCRATTAPLVALLAALAPRVAVSSMSERDTLLRFYGKTGGSRWKSNDGWRQAFEGGADENQRPMCSWDGVVCVNGHSDDGEKIVTGLQLSDNLLTGHVTPHLWNMPFLKTVNFGGNMLTDLGLEGLSAGGTKAPLESLILSQNQIRSLAGIEAAHDTLTELQISSNAFKGSFPSEVFKLKKLQTLRATFNSGITGELQSDIGNLIHLRELDLSFNSFSGKIPKQLGKLTTLQYLVLEENKFTGTIASEINQMIGLRYLSIGNTGANAGRLTGPLPSFTDLVHLRELFLPGNALTGSIPSDFLLNSATTQKAVTINLSSNLLSGKVPVSLAQFDHLEIDLTANRIAGIHNGLCHKKKWMDGLVGEYGCDAILCPKGTYSERGRQESEAETCLPCRGGEEYGPYLGATDCIADLDYEEEIDDIEEGVDASSSGAAPPARPAAASSKSEGGALGGAAKFFIALVALAVPVVLGAALYKGVMRSVRKQEEKSSTTLATHIGIPEDSFTEESNMDTWQGSFRAKKASSTVSDGEPERCIL